MTEAEVVLIAQTLAPIVRDIVRETKAALQMEFQTELLTREAALRERLVALETREPVPGPVGPPGPPGQDGRDGQDGRHGKDGTAGLVYRGVFLAGDAYAPGDLVTWAGSAWHCKAATTSKPGEAAADWTLMVKRGRDGKDLGRP
jgi:hypothetical protein